MSDQVLNLFRQRLEQRLGQRTELDPEMAAFGQGLGLGPPTRQRGEGGSQAPQVATLSNQAPGGAPAPAMPAPMPRQPTPMPSAPAPSAPAQGLSQGPQRDRIPALDGLADRPRQRHRGLVHDRKLGRVLQGDV